MAEVNQVLSKAEQIFCNYVDEIEHNKLAEISIRRALKKYDVKNLKINNVTPLRAKKMYSTIIPKYSNPGITNDKCWLQNERRLFIWCALCYLHKNSMEVSELREQDFQFLKSMFPFKSIQLVKFQINSLIKKDNRNSGWLEEEDQILRRLVQRQSNKVQEWSLISKQFFITSQEKYFRNAKQCRQRWLNYLDPNKTKGKWEHHQDVILLKQVLNKGKKWSKIVQALDGKKNQHMIKNRYKSLIHKKQKVCKSKKINQNQLIKMILHDYQQKQTKNEDQEEYSDNQKMQKVQYDQNMQQSIQDYQSENIQVKPKKSNEKQYKTQNFFKLSQNWPIIVQPSNKKIHTKQQNLQKIEQNNQKQSGLMVNQIQICGNKPDKQFVNNLFYSVNTPLPEDNKFPHMMESRSPALFSSPFPTIWTPNVFILEDSQITSSPLGFADFSAKARNFTGFIPDEKRQ